MALEIRRISDQGNQTLEAFYTRLAESAKASPVLRVKRPIRVERRYGKPDARRARLQDRRIKRWRAYSDMMLRLLSRLKGVDHPPVWAFTSHSTLLLTERDTWHEWLVTVHVEWEDWMDDPRFRVTYALPDPWYSAVAFAGEPERAALLVIDGLERALQAKARSVTSEWQPRSGRQRWRLVGKIRSRGGPYASAEGGPSLLRNGTAPHTGCDVMRPGRAGG